MEFTKSIPRYVIDGTETIKSERTRQIESLLNLLSQLFSSYYQSIDYVYQSSVDVFIVVLLN
jgi:hypothetical protein